MLNSTTEPSLNGGELTLGLTWANHMSLRDAARFYVQLGWKVVPLWPVVFDEQLDRRICGCGTTKCERKGSQGKHPWKNYGLHSATTDLATIDAWWGARPDLGVAIALEPSGLVAADRDHARGERPAGPPIDKWGFEPGAYAHARSGSGADHYIWRVTEPLDKPQGIFTGVDTKYDGYVVAAPTQHISGERYQWLTDRLPGEASPTLRERFAIGLPRDRNEDDYWRSDERVDRDAIMRGDWQGAGYDTHRNALIALITSHWAQGKVSRDEILDLTRLAAKRGETRPDEPWESDEVERLVNDLCDKKPRGPSEGYRLDQLPEELLLFAKSVAANAGEDLSEARQKALVQEEARRWARRALDEAEVASTRGPRIKRTLREYAVLEQPRPVLADVLAAEVNLLGGPSEAGKSLLARDWAFDVARGGRNVLWVASEGMHDVAERFTRPTNFEGIADRLFILDEPVNLLAGDDAWILKEYRNERPALVVFDLIYAMGMTDDNGVKDVMPVIAALKRISADWGAATLAVCHSGHGDERRVRGSSVWRQQAAVEWHMANGSLTCEKSKIADKTRLSRRYVVEYPNIRWLSRDAIGDVALRALRKERERDDMIVRLVREAGPLGISKTAIWKSLGGNKKDILAAIDSLLSEKPATIEARGSGASGSSAKLVAVAP